MLKFIIKVIYIAIFLGIIGYVIYMVGGAAFADAKAQAQEMIGQAGPMFAIGILFIAIILSIMGEGKK